MSSSLIAQLRKRRDSHIDAIEAIIDDADTQHRDLTALEDAKVTSERSAAEKINDRIDELLSNEERRNAQDDALRRFGPGGGSVTRVNEAELYREDSEHDFVRDVAAALTAQDSVAATRLAHHNEEHRATVSGGLGGFVIPQFALDLAALAITNGRPFANIVTQRPLTSGTVVIPRQSSNTEVDGVDELEAGPDEDFETDDDLTASAKTLTGFTDLSVQSFDFSQLDSGLVLSDLRKQYDQSLDLQALTGNTSKQLPGILTRTTYSGLNTIDASAVELAVQLWGVVSAAKAAVRNGVNAPATHLVLNPEVWSWIESATDSEGRPLFGHSYSSPQNVQGAGNVFNGLTVVEDANCPVDKAIVLKADEVLLWETGPATMTIDQVGAHTGTIRFVIRGYAAFESLRYTGAVKVIAGIPEPTFDIPTGSED
jgi:HK97 family phage major capsid protein